jgi:RNA polymerase sigma-70 factor (ECF subfamily)
MTDTSLSLLDELRTGENSVAWNRLVGLYSPLLHRWIARYDTLQPADVDDLVQDVLLAISREIRQFDHRGQAGSFRAWLKAILLNRLRAFWRRRANHPGAVGGSDFQRRLDELADNGSTASRMWDSEHDRHVMHQLLEHVRPRFADQTWRAFSRQVVDGAEASSVAAEMGMPLHSIYAAKSRVLAALRAEAHGLIGK